MATVDIGQFIDDIEKRPIIWSRDVNVANKGWLVFLVSLSNAKIIDIFIFMIAGYLEDTWHELAEIYNCSSKDGLEKCGPIKIGAVHTLFY